MTDPVNGCRYCGKDRRAHAQEQHAGRPGFEAWVEPTDEQRKERLRVRAATPAGETAVTDAGRLGFQAVPDQGYSYRDWVDAIIKQRLAAAAPATITADSHECWYVPCGCSVHGDHLGCDEGCTGVCGCVHPLGVEVTAPTEAESDRRAGKPVVPQGAATPADETARALRIDADDWQHIYWRDPVEGCWVAYKRLDCIGDEEVPDTRLPTALAITPAEPGFAARTDVPALVAEVERLREEVAEYAALLARQGDLLTSVANALRGDPPPLTTWSHHDLPERAAAAVADADTATICPYRFPLPHWAGEDQMDRQRCALPSGHAREHATTPPAAAIDKEDDE